MAKAFDKLIDQINKTYKSVTIVRAADSKLLADVQRIRTGVLSFDIAIGGGVPRGRIIQLLGHESSGKSALALRIAGAFQRHCRNCSRPMFRWDEVLRVAKPRTCCKNPEPCRVVWLDIERSWTNRWAENLTVDTSKAYLVRADYAEQAIDVADEVIRSGDCDLLVVDSVAALTPAAEIELSAEAKRMGLQPKLMSETLRKWTSAQNVGGMIDHKAECTIALINQIRFKIGVIYGSPETNPGGKALQHYASITARFKKGDFLGDEAGRPTGLEMECVVKKNKTAPPMRQAKFSLNFMNTGPYKLAGCSNHAEQVLALAVYWNLVKQGGSWYTLAKGVKYQGAEAAAEALCKPENAKVLKMLEERIWKNEVAWLEGPSPDGEVG